MTPPGARPLVLFDGDCGFCAASVRVMRGRWFRAEVTAEPFQRVDLTVHGLTAERCEESLHVVDGTRVFVGGAAIARTLRASRGPWPVVGAAMTVPGIRWVVERCYRLVARRRHELPGGTAACER